MKNDEKMSVCVPLIVLLFCTGIKTCWEMVHMGLLQKNMSQCFSVVVFQACDQALRWD